MADLALGSGIGAQLRLIAWLRWRLFRNALRKSSARLDLLGLIIVGVMMGTVSLGIGILLGVGAYALIRHQRAEFLPLLLWAVFIFWHLLPVMIAGFRVDFDFRSVLRFPLHFSSFFLIHLAYGLADPVAISGLFWLTSMTIGIALARVDMLPWVVVILGLFGLVNLLVGRVLSSWLEKLLARRRAREIFGALFLFLILLIQFSGMIVNRWGSRAAPVVRKLAPALELLPPGLAGKALTSAIEGQGARVLSAMGILLGYGLAFGLWLRQRLHAQYLGEDLSETEAPVAGTLTVSGSSAGSPAASWVSRWLPGPIAAIVDKEFRYLIRNSPMILTLLVPIILVFAFLPAWTRPARGRSGAHLAAFQEFLFPIGLAYVLLLLTNMTHNSFAYDGRGIQLLLVAPVRFRDVLLGKNLAQAVVLGCETLLMWCAVSLLSRPPTAPVVLLTVSALLFAALVTCTVGNVVSLYFPRRLEFGDFRRQRASGMTVFIGIGANLFIFGMVAAVMLLTRLYGVRWLGVLVFLFLAGAALWIYLVILERSNQIATDQRETLAEQLAR